MKINILHNHTIFGEFFDYLVEILKEKHEVKTIKKFEYDDSDLTFSVDSLNTQQSLLKLKPAKYRGLIVHWLMEIFPPDERRSFISQFRINQLNFIKDKFHHIFVRDPRQINELNRVYQIKSPGYLLGCPNPNLHKRIQSEKKYDLLFFGNRSPRRNKMLNRIRELGFNIHIPPKYVWQEEKIQLINESKIILNIHYDKTNVYETLRVAECLGSGGFFLTEDFEWYPHDKLCAGKDFIMVPYDKIPQTIEYYLTHEKERIKIADTGYQSIWKSFNWKEEFSKVENIVITCPVCGSTSFVDFPKCTSYKVCQNCFLHRQTVIPEKTYEGPEENFGMGPHTGHKMSDEDKKKNENLANALYSLFKPKKVLDIGSKYPYFLSILKDRAEVIGVEAIKDVIKYGEELEVPVICDDFEKMDITNLRGKFDLITLIHLVEHLYDPKNTLGKAIECLTDTGILYIRTPDPEVSGIERDLTDHHLTIHPHLFTRKTLDTILNKHMFRIFRQDRLEGYGQSDFYAHRIQSDQTISLCMIVKNEEKNIRDCLDSIKNHVDEIIIVDTGSDDKTKEVVAEYTDKIYDYEWNDDFAAARNFSISKATCTNIIWADADDLFVNPWLIKDNLKEGYDAYNFNIIYGNDTFCHARLFRNHAGVHFKGRVHEYAVLHWLSFKIKTDLNVIHKVHKHSSENRILRNIRILRKEIEEGPENSRALFYLANALKEQGSHEEALNTYQKYLTIATWKDERFMARKYMGQILLWQKKYQESLGHLFKAVQEDPKWAEAYYYIGENYFYMGLYETCIRWMIMASTTPEPETQLFKEMAIYRDLPYRYIFACYEWLEEYDKAYKYSIIASEKNPGDEWLKQRAEHFKKLAGKEISKKEDSRDVHEFYRQGALGDCLMTTAALRLLKNQFPHSYFRYITAESSMPILKGNKYIDELTTEGKSDATRKCYFSYPDKNSPIKDEGYPHKPLTRHIVTIFNECAGIKPMERQPDPSKYLKLECTLNDVEEAYGASLVKTYGKYITLHIQAGWSPYKEWYDDRWEHIVEELFKLGHPTLQIGTDGDRILKNTVDIRDISIKHSIAAIKHAVLHLGIDSFSNHATAAVNTSGVILFGSTSPTGSGYPHNTNIWKGFTCSPCYKEYEWAQDPNGPCTYDKKCMREITVDEVLNAIMEKLNYS